MKSLSILLLLVVTETFAQQCKEVAAYGLSLTSNKGIAAEIAYLSQEGRWGASIGLIVSSSSEIDKDGQRIHNPEFIIFSEVLYRILSKDYIYSINAIGGVLMDTERSIAGYGGVNLRIPLNNKALFCQGVYRTDNIVTCRAGIYFPFN